MIRFGYKEQGEWKFNTYESFGDIARKLIDDNQIDEYMKLWGVDEDGLGSLFYLNVIEEDFEQLGLETEMKFYNEVTEEYDIVWGEIEEGLGMSLGLI